MKKVVLIPDSFKGTMSSMEVCSIMKKAVQGHYPECEVISIPVADGGEGTVDAFLEALGGVKVYRTVTGPYFGEKVQGYFGLLPDNTAVIEMATAASLVMVGEKKNPSKTTTYGVGELILEALSHNVKKIILGLGGSATNDAGCGLASALGVSFYDDNGGRFIPVGGTLDRVSRIERNTADKRLWDIPIITMCDIDNPFHGESGAAVVYAPQKGADEKMVGELDEKMRKLASVIKRDCHVDVQKIPGSGAAGGMGGGMAAFFSSRLEMGIETILEAVHFSDLIEGADYVYTGEGRIDSQSLRGKVVVGVAREAKKKNIPVIAFVGDADDDIEGVYEEGVTAVFSINRVALPYKEQRLRAKNDLFLTVDNLLRYEKTLR